MFAVKYESTMMPSLRKSYVKGATSQLNGFEKFLGLFNCVVCNPCQSSPSLTILVPLWFIIISLMFFNLCKTLFSGFLQFKGKFVDYQNTSKYRDRAPIMLMTSETLVIISKICGLIIACVN